jgi:hypothetical protein
LSVLPGIEGSFFVDSASYKLFVGGLGMIISVVYACILRICIRAASELSFDLSPSLLP